MLVDIIDIALPSNFGVAKENNLTIFVPEAVLGDRLQVTIIREHKKFSYGKIVKIERPSPFRVNAKCQHFNLCGGCTIQNLNYEKQLLLKENYLLETLGRIGGIDLKNIETCKIIPSPDSFFYRNKLEFSFSEEKNRVILGLKERSTPFRKYSGEITPLAECLIFSPVVKEIFPIILEFCRVAKLTAYNPVNKKGFLEKLILREAKSTKKLMVILVTRNLEVERYSALLKKSLKSVASVESIYWVISQNSNERPRTQQLIYGRPCIEETIGNYSCRIYPNTFLQPNTAAAELLYRDMVKSLAPAGNEKALGLYCGSGAIEIFLSGFSREVTGIDISSDNIACAKENASINRLQNCTFYAADAERSLKEKKIKDFDILIVDPPRRGLAPQTGKLISQLSAAKVAYISCNPATLARDLSVLKNNYKIKKIIPFDFFPHTSHVEALVLLEK